MAAETVLCAGVRAALAPLALNGMYDATPPRAREPFAVVEPGVSADWSVKDRRGCELRPAITIVTAGDDPGDLRGLLADAIKAIDALPPDLPGWRVASCVLIRSRQAREREGRWLGRIEFRVRMMEEL